MVMARSMAYAFALVLIERVANVAARASAPTWSTPGKPCKNVRIVDAELVAASRSADLRVAIVVTPAVYDAPPDVHLTCAVG